MKIRLNTADTGHPIETTDDLYSALAMGAVIETRRGSLLTSREVCADLERYERQLQGGAILSALVSGWTP